MTVKAAVVGNCQAHAFSRCVDLLTENLQTDCYVVWDLAAKFPSPEAFSEAMSRYDLLFIQHLRADPDINPAVTTIPPLDPALASRVVAYPNLQFHAFHPDVVYAYAANAEGGPDFGRVIPSASGDYNSALVMFGYMNGLEPAQIIRLFRKEVFERLGYFGLWPLCEKELFAVCAETGFPVGDYFYEWARRGCFMHSFNHPKLFAMINVVRHLLEGAGIRTRPVDCEDFLQDPGLDSEISPLYPEVAARFGLPGAYIFKKTGSLLLQGAARALTLDLNQFVRGSLERHSGFDPRRINCSRVNEWNSNAVIAEFLREAAAQ